MIITRKIQLIITNDDVKGVYKQLYDWNEKVFRAANFAATHQYFQENMKEFFYLNDDIKIKLADASKDGIFNTSRPNTTYRVLSDKFKGTAPMAMISAVNNGVTKNFQKERKEYFSGKRSLRTYRRDIPMPVPTQLIRDWKQSDDGNFTFSIAGVCFKTFFGRDASRNRIIFENPEYELCDSSIKLDGKKIFLLAVVKFTGDRLALNKDKEAIASLSCDTPIIFESDKLILNIGNAEEFLHRRIAIQGALSRLQKASRYNRNGKGRAKKMKATERYHKNEYNYVHTRLHQYSKKLIDLCIQNKCGKLILKDQDIKEDEAKQDEFLLRNWSYYGLKEMIKYKCQKVGIEVL